MNTLPNEIMIHIMGYLDPPSYVSFLHTGFRPRELTDPLQYNKMKERHKIYLDNLKKEGYRKNLTDIVQNKDFGEVDVLKEHGIVDTDNLDTSHITSDVIDIIADLHFELEADNNGVFTPDFIFKILDKINSLPQDKQDMLNNAMQPFGQSILDNNNNVALFPQVVAMNELNNNDLNGEVDNDHMND